MHYKVEIWWLSVKKAILLDGPIQGKNQKPIPRICTFSISNKLFEIFPNNNKLHVPIYIYDETSS